MKSNPLLLYRFLKKQTNVSNLVLFVLSALVLISCNEGDNKSITAFKSDFSTTNSRTWIGPEYWANPLQDWQISDNRIECLVSNENRNIHLLTRQIGTEKGTFEMNVRVGFFNKNISNSNKNWAGFSIGSKGEFSDFRDNAVFGKGINVGVCTNGSLFIGEPSYNNKNDLVINELKNGVDLKVIVSPKGSNYTIDFSIYNSTSGELLGNISKGNVSSKQLNGDLVLVSNFENPASNKVDNTKSVWFKNWNIKGTKVTKHNDRTFGPILFSQYTLSRNILKLTAQMAPVNDSTKQVYLEVKENEKWKPIASSFIDKDARTARFKLPNWDDTKEYPYRLVYDLNVANGKTKIFYWEGIIRKNPKDKDDIIVAAFTGNNDLGFPNTDIVNQVKYQDPDLLFFSGDQIYEPVGGYGIQRGPHDIATLDYLRKWYLYGWAYRDLLKSTPAVVITDDHDVYMGNIWGESGRASLKNGTKTEIQDSGGYRMSPEWVNMVERTQTSHLPDPYDVTPIQRGIGVYYTQMNYGNISFAIIEDRKFKSAPKALIPDAEIVNGWPQNNTFNIANADVPMAKLLGERQLNFLDDWASDWSYGTEMKVLLSQTIFANVATLPEEAMTDAIVPTLRILNEGEYPTNDMPVTDMDSNGWPQTGRNKAIETIRKGFTFHLAGDQHLGSVIQYGVDEFNDGGYAFCVPSISNYWPRRWYPMFEGTNREKGMPKYTGEYEDGFGNKISVHAISNPLYTNKKPTELYDRAAGYGVVRFHKELREIVLECWPRGADPIKGNREQYNGWPITITQSDNFGKNGIAYLPEIKIKGITNPVVQVIDESDNSVVYTLRINGDSFTPKVFKTGNYTIKVSEPDENLVKEIKNVSSENADGAELIFNFIKD